MGASFQLQFPNLGITPLYPSLAEAYAVALAANQVLARGTVLGELIGASGVQTVVINNGSAGTFTLTYKGQTTGTIAYNASPNVGAGSVQAKLRALSTIGGDNVVVTGSAGSYTITFSDLLAFQTVALFTGDATSLTAGTNEVQTFSIIGTPTGGTFTLSFKSVATGTIAYNADAPTIQTALRAISTINGANVTVSGTNPGPFTVTFIGTLAAAPQPLLVGNGAALTGGSGMGVTVAEGTLGVIPLTIAQTTVGGAGTRGTFKAYASGNTDGSQVAKCILQFDCAVDASGNITLGGQTGGDEHHVTQPSAPAFFVGDFKCEHLTGLDATAVTALGRLTEGTTTSGIMRMP
jgi:hypothetical protein